MFYLEITNITIKKLVLVLRNSLPRSINIKEILLNVDKHRFKRVQ